MDESTRILLVEDNIADAELNKREARKVLDNCSFMLVETEEAFLEQLRNWQPHLVLSDYTMPEFDGLTALALALENAPETPVIIVTGSVNEDTAVECMKAGATNYVIKQSIKRLGTAILHALEERTRIIEHRLAQTALSLSERRYRELFELSPLGIIVQDSNNVILNVNIAYCKISGFSEDELLGKRINNVGLGKQELKNIKINTSRILAGETLRHEVKNTRSDGQTIFIELTESGIILNDGSMGVLSIVADITERKLAEESLHQQTEFLQRMMDAIPIPVFYKDVNGVFLGCNNALEAIQGINKEDVKGKTVFDLHPKQMADLYFETDIELIKQGGEQTYEAVIVDKANQKRDLIVRKATYNGADGKIAGLVGSFFDITERKAIEEDIKQKNRDLQFLSEFALKLSELSAESDVLKVIIEELISLTGAAFTTIARYDKTNKTLTTCHLSADTAVLNTMAKEFGRNLMADSPAVNEEMINQILKETFISFDTLSALTFGTITAEESDRFNSLTGINRYFGITLHMADELFGTIAIGLRPDQPDPDHEMIKSFTYLSSLTLKRRKAEEDLREREDRLQKIVNSSQDAMIIMDARGCIYLWNQSAEKMFGYSASEVAGRNLHNLIVPGKYFEQHLKVFKKFVESGEGTSIGKLIELQAIKKNGEDFPIELALSAIRIDNSWFSVGAVRDITERKKAEEALIKNEKKYRELFDSNKDGVAVLHINPDNRTTSFVEVNEAAARLLGYSREELITIPVNDLDSEYTEQKGAERRDAFTRQGSYTFETQFFHKSGRLIPVEISASFVNYDSIPSFLNIIRDISERKFREKLQKMQYNIANSVINANSLHAVYESVRNELSNIIDTTNFFVAFYNKETGMMQAPFEQELDSIEEWPADKSLSGYIVKQQKSLLINRDQISEMAEKGIINLIGTRSEKWLGVPLFSGKKAIGAMVVQSYDNPNAYNEDSRYILELAAYELGNYISRKEAEQYAIKLSKAVEQNPVSIVITDKEGFIEYVNPKFTEITGYTLGEAVGKKPNILKSGEQSNAFYKDLWETITSGIDWQGVVKNIKKDGSFYWENVIISPILNGEGVITNFVAVKEDITEKKKTIEELEKAKLKAEESDRLKTAFLQNISHEIRTPLNGILGFSELLVQDWTTPEEKAEYNEAIQISGRRLVEIVSNVLDISIIETGQIMLNPGEINLNAFMTELYNFFRNQAVQKGLQLFYLPGSKDNSLTINVDRARINQIFINLINNAIKYTKKGEIRFGYTLKTGRVIFNVTDTGIGIKPVHHSMIFTRFYQADDTSARNYEGAGLGLSISQGLVKAMGGDIWFESEPEKGTSFSFSLPAPEIVEEPEVIIKADNQESGQIITVLIADDDDTSYLLLATTLKRRKLGSVRAETGIEALEMVKKHPQLQLVFMDIKMPEMDGLEATRILKETNPGLPVVIQTAFAFVEDKDKSLSSGADEYLSKPIASEKLQQVLDKYLK